MPRTLLPTSRTRIINFRVTEQEFEQLRSACATAGGTNLSEFARKAVLDVANCRSGPAPGLADCLDSLDQRLAHIDSTVGDLVLSLRARATIINNV